MAKIPLELITIGAALRSSPHVQDILIAAILRSEDEVIVLTIDEIRAARSYHLIVTDVTDEEGSIALTARPR